MNFNYDFLPIKFNIPQIKFRANTTIPKPKEIEVVTDGFTSNPLYDKFGSKTEIEAIAKTNSRIQELLKEYNIPLEVNIEELEKLKQEHLKTTRVLTAQIYSALPEEIKKEVSLPHLQESALLHDYGKVLIPKSILNKKGKLTPKEKEIMELHSEFGYELLKNKGISKKTAELVKYHHQNIQGTGYPRFGDGYEPSYELQILNIADKFSALIEQRCYKNALGKYEAFEIIAKDVNKGLISQDVFTALTKAV